MAVVASSGSAPSRRLGQQRRRLSVPLFSNKAPLESAPLNANSKTDSNANSTRRRRSHSSESTPTSSSLNLSQTSSLSSNRSLKSSFQTSPPTLKKSVSFASIYIREHCRDICLNPSVSSGPAVGLGWDFCDHPTGYDVSLFEETRPPRRSRSEFQLPRPVREQILLQDTGVSRQELVAAVRSINVAKRQRQHSVASQDADGAHMAFEWVSGKMKKMVGRKVSYAKEEQRLWTQARVLALERVKDQEAAAAVNSQ